MLGGGTAVSFFGRMHSLAFVNKKSKARKCVAIGGSRWVLSGRVCLRSNSCGDVLKRPGRFTVKSANLLELRSLKRYFAVLFQEYTPMRNAMV